MDDIIDMNHKLLILLGIATSMILDYKNLEAYHDNADKCDWFIKAIDQVVYQEKPLPAYPIK